MSRRRDPRPAGEALRSALRRAAPKTRLAAVQSVWPEAVGERLAAAARPVAERGAEIEIACADPVWAQELDLMQEDILARLREHLGESSPERLRFRVKDV